jgi:hypothetical protein
MPMLDNSGTYLRSEVLVATGATRGQIAGLLEYCISQQGHSPGALHRWPRDEIVLTSVALKLTRLGIPLSTVKATVDAMRSIRETGELGVVMLTFDAAGRFVAATRLKRGALPGDLTKALKVPAAFGFRLLINVAAEASNIDVRLRQHRADHGAARRGPKMCRKSA